MAHTHSGNGCVRHTVEGRARRWVHGVGVGLDTMAMVRVP